MWPSGLQSANSAIMLVSLSVRTSTCHKTSLTVYTLENDVNGEVLIEITNTLLKELGVRTVGERVRILVALKRLRQACVNAARSALQVGRMPLQHSHQRRLTNIHHYLG